MRIRFTLFTLFQVLLFVFIYKANAIGQTATPDISDLIFSGDTIKYENPRKYSTELGKKYNDPTFYNHPDFGKLTFSAPHGKDVVEVISKRTLVERYYVDLNDPTFFYIEKSNEPINFEKNGVLRAIDPSLHPFSYGVYKSGEQPVPTLLDLNNHRSMMILGESIFGFNNTTLKTISFDNSEVIYQPNWNQIEVGNFGAYITNVFPGVDLNLVYRQGGVKSEYIIKENLNVKELIFIDHLELPDHLVPVIEANDDLATHLFVQIYNTQTGQTEVVFDPARGYDASQNRKSYLNPYHLDGNNLEIICDSSFLNSADMIYPLVVDPLVIAVGPIASAINIRGSLLSPAFCSNNIVVSFPAGSTPWDVQAAWNVSTDFCARTFILFGFYDDCYLSDAQVWITSSCGGVSPVGAPGTIWTCLGCNVIGTWNPTLPFASSGTQSLAQCFAPACVAQNLTFTMNDNRAYCTSYTVYDNCTWANSYCVSLDQWSITVQGRTLETLGNTTTGNGSMTINDPTCAGTSILNPTPLYGVPGYTYTWSTGATSPTISVTNTPAVYTATVTDACGNSAVATFNIGCPLPLRLNYFNADLKNESVTLQWETLSEINSSHFTVQRADKTGQFYDLEKINAHENSSEKIEYRTVDNNPLTGLSYYRLAITDLDGSVEYSDVKSVLNDQNKNELMIVPNPNKGSFELICSSDFTDEGIVEVYNSSGIMVKTVTVKLQKGSQSIQLEFADLPAGIYFLKFKTRSRISTEKLVID